MISSMARAMMGNSMRARMMMPASREARIPKAIINVNPKAPYTMEGIPHNTSSERRT